MHARRMKRRAVWVIALAGLAALSGSAGRAEQTAEHWIGTWFASSTARVDQPVATAPTASAPTASRHAVAATSGQSPLHFSNQTLRQIAHITLGARGRWRVVLSNTFGSVPAGDRRGADRDQRQGRGDRAEGESRPDVRRRNPPQQRSPSGAILVSDPVDSRLRPTSRIWRSICICPDDTAAMNSPITTHPASWQTNYVSTPGNYAGAVTLPVQTTTAYRRGDGLVSATWFFLARVEVMAPWIGQASSSTLGDSITDGTASTNRYQQAVARRARPASGQGGACRMARPQCRDRRQPRAGRRQRAPTALARFDRDVIAKPGVTHVIVLEGINDIGQARSERVAGRGRVDRRARADDRARACARSEDLLGRR